MDCTTGQGDRKADLIRFHGILETLSDVLGGPRTLADCDLRELPPAGVCFFMEHGEYRTHTGPGLRVVHVVTHSTSEDGNAPLSTCLRKCKGYRKTGGGNHRESALRRLVGEALRNLHGVDMPSWGQGETAPRKVREREQPLERLVSITIRRMPFLWLDVPDDGETAGLRQDIVRNAIALLSNHGRSTPLDPPSPSWLGLFSDRELVRDSGLWNDDQAQPGWDPAFLDVMEHLVLTMKPTA